MSPLQLLVAPLQKLTPKANATIKDVGTIESLVQSFGPYITGTSFWTYVPSLLHFLYCWHIREIRLLQTSDKAFMYADRHQS